MSAKRRRWRPACMTEAELDLWRRDNGTIPVEGPGRLHRPCHDCPADFAAEMRALGRCNGEPSEPAARPSPEKRPGPPREEEEASLLRCYQPADVLDLRLGADSGAFRRAS